MAPRLKVTGPKVHAHAHLPLMCSLQTQIGHAGINTFDTAVCVRFPRSSLEGQRSQHQISMFVHIYPSSGVHRHKLATFSHWHQYLGHRRVLQISKIKITGPKIKDHRTKIQCPSTSTLHGSTDINWSHWHEYLGHSSIHKIRKFKVIISMVKVHRTKISWPQWRPQKFVDRQSDYFRAPVFS